MLAVILHKQGLDVWSARVLGLAETLTGTSSNEREWWQPSSERFRIGDIRAEVRAQLGDEAFAREYRGGPSADTG